MGKINLQMYSFMDGTMNDTKENLKAAAEMGYDGVELFGPNFQIPAGELALILKEFGLTPVSLHTQTDEVLSMIPYAKKLGMEFVGIGMESLPSDEAVYAFAEKLNKLGKACKEEGLMVTYHNHTQEFGPCGNQTILEALMERTNSSWVGFELDAGWCAAAGTDPIAFLKQHPGRVKLVHIKESSEVIGVQPPLDFEAIPKDEKGNPVFSEQQLAEMERQKKINCPAGQGIVDWKALKQEADKDGCKAYIVEREYTYGGSRRECLEADIDYYRTVI